MKDLPNRLLRAESPATNGEFLGRSLLNLWFPPDRVDAFDGTLKFWSTHEYWTKKASGWIRPPADLLDAFIALGNDSPDMRALRHCDTASPDATGCDRELHAFASRYGALRIFYHEEEGQKWPNTVHTEYCEVWKYFARSIRALIRIACELHRDRSGLKEDWHWISTPPAVMREAAWKLEPRRLSAFPVSDEENWMALTVLVSRRSQQNRINFGHLLNTLLGLAEVRPWFRWAAGQRKDCHPAMSYASRSLLSNLALQLCLRVSNDDAFFVCTHCQKQYKPSIRAPKSGQRNFCQECRKRGVSKKYALDDYRRRQRASV